MRLTNKKCNFGYTNTNNKLNSITIGANTYNYLYDNAGNLVQENSSRFFQWDAGNNMRCFYNQAGTSEPTVYAQYLYDAAGNRVKKLVRTQGGTYESVSYIGGLFDYKTDGTDDQATCYIMDNTSRIAMIRTGEDFGDTTPAIKYNLEDDLGSSMVLLDTNGTLVNKEEYYPFGETSFGSYAKKRYRFSGKERDSESGLYYYGARYYLSMSCRFISVDPKYFEYSWQSSFAFAINNPLKYIDINGEGPGDRLNRLQRKKDALSKKAFQYKRMRHGKMSAGRLDKAKRIQDKANKIGKKIASFSHDIQSEGAGKGLNKMGNHSTEGKNHSEGNGSGTAIQMYWRPVAPTHTTLGFRAAFLNRDGSFTVLDIGRAKGASGPDQYLPVWSASGIKALEKYLGKSIDVQEGDRVHVSDEHAILDQAGDVLVPALLNVFNGDSVSLLKKGENITETDRYGEVLKTYEKLKSDAIIHFYGQTPPPLGEPPEQKNTATNVDQLNVKLPTIP